MKKMFLTTMAAVALVSTPAIAQEAITESHLQMLDTNGDDVVSKSEYVAYMDKAFDALDANNDGILQPEELAGTVTEQHINAMDLNGNGTISRFEFDTQVMKDFDTADQSGTGALN